MTIFRAPVNETMFVLDDVLGIGTETRSSVFANLDPDTVRAILNQAATLAETVLHPLNARGDRQGCTRNEDGTVRTPAGFDVAYAKFVDEGWLAAGGSSAHGGQEMPSVLTLAFQEYFWSANCSLTMYLSHLGHAELLLAYGTPEQQRTYVPELISGRWSGAMGLTEPQAGSDLGLVLTRASSTADGSYRITGSKMFTSGGEHDLTENIVHLVLARIDGSPTGTRGLSLFLVPKFLPDASGRPGVRNAVHCVGVEHKMGLRGSATCVMTFDGATGYLVGKSERGLAAMFVLMNHTRLSTAVQALGMSEIAYQNAAAHVRERLQGRTPGGARRPELVADPLVTQPDVRRILLGIRSFNESARALVLWTALQSDLAKLSTESASRDNAAARVSLLTPVLKGMIAETAFDNAVAAQQLFGGHGYITDTGVDQFVRDVRMSAIGEGVTAIQAHDLVHRKIGQANGSVLEDLLAEIEGEVRSAGESWKQEPMRTALDHLRVATATVRSQTPEEAAAGAVHYLNLFGRVTLGWMWLRLLRAAENGTADSEALADRRTIGRSFLQTLPTYTEMRASLIAVGSTGLMELPDHRF